MIGKPVPRIDAVNAPFFAGCNDGKVLMQRCGAADCGSYIYYPRVCCPVCRRGDLDWIEVSGRGRIATFTIVHRPHHEGFSPKTPYIFAAVWLEEGPLIYGRLEVDPIKPPALNAQVEPVFIEHTLDQRLLAFRLSTTLITSPKIQN